MTANSLNTAALSHRAEQLLRESGALIVIVIRPDDVAYAADPQLAPKDFGETLENEIPTLVDSLAQKRGKR